jgi:hypothetical protein
MSFHKSFVTAGTDISDATALQHHIKSGKTAYIASGKVTGSAYTPAMMKLNGSTGYYSKTSVSVSGNKFTQTLRIQEPPFAGGGRRRVANIFNGTYNRLLVFLYSSDYATASLRNKVSLFCQSSSGGNLAFLISGTDVVDGNLHAVKVGLDADAGTAHLIVNGADDDDTGNPGRITPTTGTAASGSSTVSFGAGVTPSDYMAGQIGFIGYRDAYLTNHSDFFQSDGTPKPLDESAWTEWGAQPLFWNEHGQMDNNLGSAGNMTKNGSIILAPASSWS